MAHALYVKDIELIADLDLPWNKLENSKILVTGSTGMIGSLLIDVVMYKNNHDELNCSVIAIGRNANKAAERFAEYIDHPAFFFVSHDVCEPLELDEIGKVDYVLHLASNTHPKLYATDPIGTITTNIIGTKNLLDFACDHNCRRFVLASSNEIYGENRGDTELFDENYCGYINSNTLRAGYPESKRCSEALCQAYKSQKGVDVVIARLTRSYGPSLLPTDTKAMSQFLWNALAGEPIVLKSEGTQQYSYIYAGDAVRGILWLLTEGKSREAYNLSGKDSDVRLRDLAGTIAELAGTEVIFDLPDAVEAAGYSKATKAMLDDTKIRTTGYEPVYDIKTGLNRTMKILGEVLE